MKISRFSIHHRATVYVLLVGLIVAGVYSYVTLPREAAPDIQIPMVLVRALYEGVSPKDMESLVAVPLEKKLSGVDRVKEMLSISVEGMTLISLEFDADYDIDDALQKVRDKVSEAEPDLPLDVETPSVEEINLSEFPIVLVSLYGDVGPVRLKQVADELEDRFDGIPGVLDAQVIGGLEREIRAEFDPERLAAYELTFDEVARSIETENVNVPAGRMDLGRSRYLVRVPGEFHSVDEISKVIVAVRNGRPVYLGDVARIIDGFKDRETYSRLNGRESVTVSIQKRSGENVIRISDDIRRILEEESEGFPRGMRYAITLDLSDDIRTMVADLENNIFSGLVLVITVIFLFMGGRNALFVALSIPYSMAISFVGLQMAGITLNMVVLFALTLALGMLVDNAVVIVENIYRHRQEGYGRVEAAELGADEVARAVIASTLTTLAAFFPILFWPNVMGKFMAFLPKTVILALTASLFVALVVNPALCARFLKLKEEKAGAKSRRHERHRVLQGYDRLLRSALRRPGITILLAVLGLAASIILFVFWGAGTEFLPTTEPDRAIITVHAPAGTRLDVSDRLVRRVEEILGRYDVVEYYVSNVGSSAAAANPFQPGGMGGPALSQITVVFRERRERPMPSSEAIRRIREELRGIPGARIEITQEENGPLTGPPVNVEILGDDLDELDRLAGEVSRRIRDVPGLVDLQDDIEEGNPEFRFRVDRAKAAMLGLRTASIGQTLKAAFNGLDVGVYREGDDEYDIVVRLMKERRNDLGTLEQLRVPDAMGRPIPILDVARLELARGPGAVRRVDQKRAVHVQAEVAGRKGTEVLRDVRKRLEGFHLPAGYRIKYRGESEDIEESKEFLNKAFAGAIGLIALVLVTEFNSIALSLIVLASVLLSLGGVMFGLLVTRTPFGIIMTGIGVISLAGIVVNNAIVLIDYTEQLRARGRKLLDAVIEGGRTRFRPVMLTAVTTVFGLIPMAVGVSFDVRHFRFEIGSESSQWWGPMAVAVIFGLSVATILTLVVVPTLYYLARRRSEDAAGGESRDS